MLTDVIKSSIFYSDFSNHLPVFQISSILNKQLINTSKRSCFRDFSENNINIFSHSLAKMSWETVNEVSDVNVASNRFNEKCNSVLDKCFPLISKGKGSSANLNKPCLTRELTISV